MTTPLHKNRVGKILAGAYITLDEMIDARFNAKDLKLQQRKKALSLLSGPNKTNFRGRGIEFEEVRAYQPGDDIRTIDWRVTARSGKAYTKLFQEERERPLLVVIDQRQSMYFGSQHCFKSVTACYLGALITWAGLHNSDRVGGLVFGNNQQQEIRPRRNRKTALSLIHTLLEFNQALSRDSGIGFSSTQGLEQSLVELRRIARPGSAIYIISDFTGFDNDTIQKHLYQLSKHCEITGLYIYDKLEQQLPPPGQYTVTDGSQKNLINTASPKSRLRYSEAFQQQLQGLHRQLGQLGIPLIEFRTDQSPLATLLKFYGTKKGGKA